MITFHFASVKRTQRLPCSSHFETCMFLEPCVLLWIKEQGKLLEVIPRSICLISRSDLDLPTFTGTFGLKSPTFLPAVFERLPRGHSHVLRNRSEPTGSSGCLTRHQCPHHPSPPDALLYALWKRGRSRGRKITGFLNSVLQWVYVRATLAQSVPEWNSSFCVDSQPSPHPEMRRVMLGGATKKDLSVSCLSHRNLNDHG